MNTRIIAWALVVSVSMILAACGTSTPEAQPSEMINTADTTMLLSWAMESDLDAPQEDNTGAGDIDAMVIVNLEQSMLKREGSKTLVADYYHRGEASLISADIGINEDGQRTSIQAIVDMQSLTYTEGMSASVLNHLKSDDFFAVETYPNASFVSTAIDATDVWYDITGDLTIKDQTHPIMFAMIQQDENIYTASFSIDRTVWDITYGSDSFFDNLGDNVINDIISYEMYLVLQ